MAKLDQDDHYRVYINTHVPSLPGLKKETNQIKTSQYTLFTFLPYNLYYQFHRYYNLYFLAAGILSMFPSITPLASYTALIPIVLTISISLIKEAWQDYKKYRHDRFVNEKEWDVLRAGAWGRVPCQSIMLGDIVKVERDQKVPADLILLYSKQHTEDDENGHEAASEQDRVCYIETSDLDGESNLKRLEIPQPFQEVMYISNYSESNLLHLKGVLEAEPPNDRIHSFNGHLKASDEVISIPLSYNNFLPRSSTLKSTAYILGVAVYIGHRTKIYLNLDRFKRNKISTLSRELNQLTLIIFILNFTAIAICVLFGGLFLEQTWSISGYLNIGSTQANGNGIIANALRLVGSYFVLFTFMLPISMFISIELVRILHAKFISWDNKLKINDKGATVRSYNLHEDLAVVKYIFTDKTGTLTCNKMKIKQYFIFHPSLDQFILSDEDKGMHTLSSLLDDTTYEPEVSLFALLLATCHSALPTKNQDNSKFTFEGSSPDETAILEMLQMNQIILESRNKSTFLIDWKGKTVKVDMIQVMEFTSDRKRMSIIVRCDEKYYLFTKGADSMILEMVKASYPTEKIIEFQKFIDKVSTTGLRVLVCSYKMLTKDQIESFDKEFVKINETLSYGCKEDAITALFTKIEGKDNYFLGGVGIDDQLQNLVPETVQFLLKADVNIWCLTGDKKETAIAIAYRCGLLDPSMDLIQASCDANWAEIYFHIKNNQKMGNSSAFVIEGEWLDMALKDHYHILLHIVLGCATVLCVRVSPLQKTYLLRLIKKNTNYTTLAIGDGANDVGMLEAAHIGVGIQSSIESGQAVRVADYSLREWRLLKRLCTVHGRFSRLRLSKLIIISIYKNFTLIWSQLWFGIFSGFSAQTIYNSYFLLLYNVIFTSLSPFLIAIFEKDVDESFLELYPELYRPLRHGYFLNKWILFKTILFSIYNSSIIFFSYYALASDTDIMNENGKATGLPLHQAFMSSLTFLTVTLRTFLYTRHWVIWTVVGYIVSISIFIGNMFVLQGADYFQLYSGSIIYQLPVYYFSLAVVPAACLLPDLCLKYYRKIYYPTDANILTEIKKMKKTRSNEGLAL